MGRPVYVGPNPRQPSGREIEDAQQILKARVRDLHEALIATLTLVLNSDRAELDLAAIARQVGDVGEELKACNEFVGELTEKAETVVETARLIMAECRSKGRTIS